MHYESSLLFYVTPHQISKKLAELSDQHYQLANKSVWDMFAGIGMDSISLATYAKNVVCSELSAKTFKNLELNVQDTNNISTINMDCCQLLKARPDVSIIYFDPPWGDNFKSGVNFDFSKVKLANGTNIIQLLQQVLNKYDYVIVKAPFHSTSFELNFDKQIKAIHAFPKPKLKFLFLENTKI